MSKTTKIFTILAVVVILLFDVYAAVFGLGTISELIADISHDYPVIPLVAGVLMGHWFWPVRKSNAQCN